MDNWIALIRHGEPVTDARAPVDHWSLSGEGRRRVAALAAQLDKFRPSVIVCSPELKARQTGRLMFPKHPIQIDEDLREQGLGSVPLLSPETFEQMVKKCFDQPSTPILGIESAEASAQRMQRAIGRLRVLPVGVISHGRIISAYVSGLVGLDGFAVWRSLRMPDVLLVNPTAREVKRIDSPFPYKGKLPR